MRLIFTILLIGLFKADAQMVINASAPYRPLEVAGSLLLDSFPNAAAAYSLRKLKSSYTGAAIRVRKDTTGQPEQDIGFVGNDLDTVSLKSFLNARSGFVVTWYSQGDSTSVDFEQSTQANQPRIALNGVIDRLAGEPSIRFDGSNDFMDISSSTSKFEFLHRSGLSSIFIVSHIRAGNADYVFYNNNNTSFNFIGASLYAAATNRVVSQVSTGGGINRVSNNLSGNNFTTTNNLFLLTNELDNNNATAANRNKLYYNNGLAVTNNTNNSTPSTTVTSGQNMTIAKASGGTLFYLNGSITELIFYKGDKTSDRSAIQTNINNYYGIY